MEITLEEWAAEWFHVHVEGKLALNTEGGYRNLIFNHIVPRLGGATLTSLSEKRIRSFYSAGFTLDTYTHVTAQMQRAAADKMGGFMENALPDESAPEPEPPKGKIIPFERVG